MITDGWIRLSCQHLKPPSGGLLTVISLDSHAEQLHVITYDNVLAWAIFNFFEIFNKVYGNIYHIESNSVAKNLVAHFRSDSIVT